MDPVNDKLSRLIDEASEAALKDESIFKRIDKHLDVSVLDEETISQAFLLTLQYRLAAEGVLKVLMKADKSLCQALGIIPANRPEKNLDLLHFYLGHSKTAEDFSLLLDLEGDLLKVLDKVNKVSGLLKKENQHLKKLKEKQNLADLDDEITQKSDKEALKSSYASYGNEAIIASLRDAIGHRNLFHLSVDALTEAIQEFGHIPKFGVQYDYLAGLKGPISRFYQAYLNGMGRCESVLAHLEQQLPNHLEKRKNLLFSAVKGLLNHHYQALKQCAIDSSLRLADSQKKQSHLYQQQLNKANDEKYLESMAKRRTMRWF